MVNWSSVLTFLLTILLTVAFFIAGVFTTVFIFTYDNYHRFLDDPVQSFSDRYVDGRYFTAKEGESVARLEAQKIWPNGTKLICIDYWTEYSDRGFCEYADYEYLSSENTTKRLVVTVTTYGIFSSNLYNDSIPCSDSHFIDLDDWEVDSDEMFKIMEGRYYSRWAINSNCFYSLHKGPAQGGEEEHNHYYPNDENRLIWEIETGQGLDFLYSEQTLDFYIVDAGDGTILCYEPQDIGLANDCCCCWFIWAFPIVAIPMSLIAFRRLAKIPSF